MSNVVLDSLLKPLEEFFTPSFVEEIAINHAGEVWLRLNGARVPWVSYAADQLSKQYLVDLIHTVANIYEKPFDPIHGIPVVYATLPGNHRFSAIAGPNVQYDERDVTGGVALNIRGGGVRDDGVLRGCARGHRGEHAPPDAQKDNPYRGRGCRFPE